MRRSSLNLPAYAAVFLCTFAMPALGQTFTRIIGTGDPVPGESHTVSGFSSAPACGGETIAFAEFHSNGAAFPTVLRTHDSRTGGFERVVGTGDAVPAWFNRTVGSVSRFAIDTDGSVAALVSTPFSAPPFISAILSNAGGTLHAVVDTQQQIPGTLSSFSTIANTTLRFDGGVVAFTGGGSQGLSTLDGAFVGDAASNTVRVIGIDNLITPLGTILYAGDCDVRDGRVVFAAGVQTSSGAVDGLYTADVFANPASYTKVMDSSDVDSFTGGTFADFNFAEIDEDDVAYYAFDSSLVQSLRSTFRDPLDNGLTLPGGQTAGSLERFHVDEERIVFEVTDGAPEIPQSLGVYLAHCDRIDLILRPGDQVDGLTVEGYTLGDEALQGDRLAMLIRFTDGSSAIYAVDLTTFDDYGDGLAGTDGVVPRIEGYDCAESGATFRLELRDGAPTLIGGFFLGLAPTNIPFLGGTVLAQPDSVVPLTLNPPSLGFPRPWLTLHMVVPAAPTLSGTTFYMQSHFADAGAPLGVSMSRGFQFTVE